MEVSGQLHAPDALLPRGKMLYPLDKRMGGPQSRFGSGGEGKNSHDYPSWELRPGRPTRSLVTILTELSRLVISLYSTKNKSCFILLHQLPIQNAAASLLLSKYLQFLVHNTNTFNKFPCIGLLLSIVLNQATVCKDTHIPFINVSRDLLLKSSTLCTEWR
jgi:hypothetical protein